MPAALLVGSKKKVSAVKKSTKTKAAELTASESVDLIGRLMGEIAEIEERLATNAAVIAANALIEAKQAEIKENTRRVLASSMLGRWVRVAAETPLTETGYDTATAPVIHGDLFEMAPSLKNEKVLSQDLVRDKIGRKVWDRLASVSLKDLETVIGKEDIDHCVVNYKSSTPRVIVRKR